MMTKQELLTRLALGHATWRRAKDKMAWLADRAIISSYVLSHTSKQDWLAERERLLNKPSWDDAPDGATHLAMDDLIPGLTDSPRWYFYAGEPTRGERVWISISGSGVLPTDYTESIAIPAGYDWKESLEERPV